MDPIMIALILVVIGLTVAVIALAMSLAELEEKLARQRIVYPCGCVYISYGKFGEFKRGYKELMRGSWSRRAAGSPSPRQ